MKNAALRNRLDLLASENQVLRQEVSAQMYSREVGVRSEGQGGFTGLGWFSRGFGNLMGVSISSKPSSPAARLMAIQPSPPPQPAQPCIHML